MVPLKESASGISRARPASAHPVVEGGLDLWARMQRAKHGDGGDCRTGQFGGDVAGDGDQPEHIDLKPLPRGLHSLQVLTTVVPETKIKGLSSDRLSDHVDVPIELVANCGPNEVGSVGVKPILHHQVDVSEGDIAGTDGDLLAVADFRPQLPHPADHRQLPSHYHLYGW